MKSLFVIPLSILLVLFSYSPQQNDEKILEAFLEQFDEFYGLYGEGTTEFVDFYAGDVITIDTKGKITIGQDEYRKSWAGVLERYDIELLEFTAPELYSAKTR